jgi:hypothetical protein
MLQEVFEQICKQLGLNYEQNLDSRRLTDQITDEIDADALLAKNERCFVVQDIQRIQSKKSLVLSSWYFNSLDEERYELIISFLEQLIHAGHRIYVSGAQGLEWVEDSSMLDRLITDMTPVSTELAIKWAAEKKLARKSVEIVNTERLLAMIRSLWESKRELGLVSQTERASDHFYPWFPWICHKTRTFFMKSKAMGQRKNLH